MKRPTTPTPDQVRLWDALDHLTAEGRHPPTIRGLMEYMGMRSTSLVQYRLIRGVRAGRVVRMGIHYVPCWWSKMIDENMEKYYGNETKGS